MGDLKVLFMLYFGLGIYTGANWAGLRHLDAKGYAIHAGIYGAFAAFGWFLATRTRAKDGKLRFGFRMGLSPAGWCLGLSLSFVVGLLLTFFA
jgi:hypothetical protein